MAHSTVSEPVVSRKTFFSGSGRMADERLHQARADLAREAVIGQQLRLRLPRDRVDDLLAAVAGVGDQHAGRPVDPLVAPGVVNLEAFGVVPDDGRLAAHGDRLVLIKPLENRNRFRRGDIGDDPAEGRFHAGNAFGDEVEFSGHCCSTHCPV